MQQELTISLRPTDFSLSDADAAALFHEPGFGRTFSDNMVVIRWSAETGWHDAELKAREPFILDPACAVLHYAQEIFEGMKAYRVSNKAINLFRPLENARRFNRSAARMAMPEMPERLFVAAIEALVKADHRWVPEAPNSFYLRPFMFASETFLGVRPSNEYIFCVIGCPTGSYFKGAQRPISLWVSTAISRAGPGGTGAAKCGGNYAASLAAQAEAHQQGCDQVIFIDASGRGWIEELGGMNLFFVMQDQTILTPALGTILPGITRQSIIEWFKSKGRSVKEVRYSIVDCLIGIRTGQVREIFACGTAAVVTGVGRIAGTHGDDIVGDGTEGQTTKEIREALLNIQFGASPSQAWTNRIDVPNAVRLAEAEALT